MNSPDEISTRGSQWYFLLHDAVVFEGKTSLKMFFRVTIQLTVFPAYGEKTKDENSCWQCPFHLHYDLLAILSWYS
jgi:hypothetical protein